MQADTTDPDLVRRALAGDRAALAAIYDRYADRVHDLCRHMLGDPDEAADVCSQVFLVAFSRLGQLRDPQRLRSWLFAIARHEVYRRSRHRSRTRLVEGVDQMDRLMAAQSADAEPDLELDATVLVGVLRTAADGLDERDRMVMELQLQGLDGEELAAALGTSVSTGYQQVHRMKERLERSVAALLVARQGRPDCDELDRLLSDWDGTFSVLWRKRVARHVDRCEVCERRRSAIPAALFGTAAALPMVPVSAVGAAPAAVRERVLAEAEVATLSGGRGWRADGFPSAGLGTPRTAVLAAAAAVLVLLVAGIVVLVGDRDDELATIGAAGSTSTTATAGAPSTTSAPTITTTVPPGALPAPDPAAPPSTLAPPPAPSSTVAPPTSTPVPPAPAPPSPTVTTSVEPGPPVQLSFVPPVLYHPTPGTGACGASVELVAVAGAAAVEVQLWWRDAGGTDGLVQLVAQGTQWRGVVEIPEGLAGPVTLIAVAVDAQGRTGVSATATAPVRACPTPG